MPGRFLKISVFLGDCFIMPHPVDSQPTDNVSHKLGSYVLFLSNQPAVTFPAT